MTNRRARESLAGAMLLWAIQMNGQDTHLVSGTAGFRWPQTQASHTNANRLPREKVESFLNSLRAHVPGYTPIHVGEFRFVPLEKGRYYLVAATGDRYLWNTDIVAPEGQGFQYTELVSHG